MSLRLIEPSLAKAGVDLLDENRPALRCRVCGKEWTPELQADGRLPKGWWKCPECEKWKVCKPARTRESQITRKAHEKKFPWVR